MQIVFLSIYFDHFTVFGSCWWVMLVKESISEIDDKLGFLNTFVFFSCWLSTEIECAFFNQKKQ